MALKQDPGKLKIGRQQLGKQAEKLAANYLQKKGFKLIVHNYRYKKAEIDLIMQKVDSLVFVEVKARTSYGFGYPETFVSDNQQDLIREAAENYILENDWDKAIRFDVIAILQQGNICKISHFEDAF
jgi:putative endonuclease